MLDPISVAHCYDALTHIYYIQYQLVAAHYYDAPTLDPISVALYYAANLLDSIPAAHCHDAHMLYPIPAAHYYYAHILDPIPAAHCYSTLLCISYLYSGYKL